MNEAADSHAGHSFRPSARRRIGLVTTNFSPVTCGVGDHTFRLACALRKVGVDVRVFTQTPASAHPEDRTVEVTTCDATTPFRFAHSAELALREWGATTAIIQYVPHVLGASRFGSLAAPLLCRALRRSGVDVLVFAHELVLPWSWRPDLALGAALNRLQLAFCVREANHFVVTTESRLRGIARLAHILGREDSIEMLPVGPGALPIPACSSGSRFALGAFSAWTPNKRPDVILDAFSHVAERIPGASLHLIGAPGNSHYARLVSDKIRTHPARDRIHVTGLLSLMDVAAAIAALDVFLFTMDVGATTRSSTLPVALGSGVPVVAFRGVETAPLFVEDRNIVFAPALNGRSFGEAILRLHQDRAFAGRVGAGGRELFEETLSWEKIAARIQRLLAS